MIKIKKKYSMKKACDATGLTMML